tara:strand:- start:2233 stop:5892 length:3660 start_codon:yes stop_codon:yes gene_type:complete
MAEENKIQQFINAIRAADTLPEGVKSELIEKYESLPKDTVLDEKHFKALEAYEDGILDIESFQTLLDDLTPREVAATDAALKEEMSPEVQKKAAKAAETPDALKPLVIQADSKSTATELKIHYPFREEYPDESHAKWFKEYVEKNDPDIKVTIVDDAKDADLVFARYHEGTPPEKLMGNPFSHVKGKNLGVVQTKDFWETKKLYQSWIAGESLEGVTANGKTILPEQLQELDKWEMEQQDKIVTPLKNQIDEVDKANLEDMKNAPLGDAQTMDSDAYGMVRQPDKPNPISTRVDINDTGPGFSRSGSDAWPVRTGENYLAAAQQGGFTVDFSLQEGGSGATKKANGYLITQIRKIPKYANLSQEKILDKLYKQILVNPDGTFATNKETIEGIANEVRKVLNKGGTINIAGSRAQRFAGKNKQFETDKLFGQFMEMVEDSGELIPGSGIIRSGGQNGFDLSALRYANKFGIPARAHFPKNKLFIDLNNVTRQGNHPDDIFEFLEVVKTNEDGSFNDAALTKKADKVPVTQGKTAPKLAKDESARIKRLSKEIDGLWNAPKSAKDAWFLKQTKADQNLIREIVSKKETKIKEPAVQPDIKDEIPTRKTGTVSIQEFWLNKAYQSKIPVASVDGVSEFIRYLPLGMRILESEINPANKINGIAATTAFEPVHVLNGHQTGILLQQNIADITYNPQAVMEEDVPTYQRTKPGQEDPRTKEVLEEGSAKVQGLIKEGDIVTVGFGINEEKKIIDYIKDSAQSSEAAVAGLGENYGVPVKVVKAFQLPEKIDIDFIEANPKLAQRIARGLNITEDALKERMLTGKNNKQAPFKKQKYAGAWYFEIQKIDLDDPNYKWEDVRPVHLEADIKTDTAIQNFMGHKYGIKNLKKAGALLLKAAPLLDYGEYVFGFGAAGVNAVISQVEKGILGVTEQFPKSRMITRRLARETAEEGIRKGLLPKVRGGIGSMGTRAKVTAASEGIKLGRTDVPGKGAKGLVKGVKLYEKYNFLYAMLSGLTLSAIETLGIISRDSFGDNSIRQQLGGDYEEWAESNGILDKIGPWPLINSLEQAEAEGILEDGFTENYINQTNNKWMGVVHEFLGTEHYDNMDKVNVVWQQKRMPKGWFTDLNDIFGVNSDNALMNLGVLPRPGLAPAIKRSPVISGIEVPFENWFLPKVGLEDWVIPDEEPILTEADEEEFANQVEPFIPATVDNNAWLGNVANMKDY